LTCRLVASSQKPLRFRFCVVPLLTSTTTDLRYHQHHHHLATMDIDHYQYRKKLLEILRSIANASFVTFDLEMSGISTRPKPGDRTYDVGKATLQQQYDEIKSAAETFQILQMGLTCVEEDREKGKFFPTYLFHRLCLSIINWMQHTHRWKSPQ